MGYHSGYQKGGEFETFFIFHSLLFLVDNSFPSSQLKISLPLAHQESLLWSPDSARVPFLHSIFLHLYVYVIIPLRSCFHYESGVSQCLFLLTNIFTISIVLTATLLCLLSLLILWCGQLNLLQSYVKGYEIAAFRQVPQSHKCRLTYQKQTCKITLYVEILRMFPFTSRTRSGGPQSPQFFNMVLEVIVVHPESERIEYTNIGKKEIKIITHRWLCMHT